MINYSVNASVDQSVYLLTHPNSYSIAKSSVEFDLGLLCLSQILLQCTIINHHLLHSLDFNSCVLQLMPLPLIT